MLFKSQDVDEKKRISGSSGMSWENDMVNLVKKLSEEVKSSPNYKEKKKQMLEERREYIKQEKMRRKSVTSNTGSLLNLPDGKNRSRPKTAQNRVSFADDSYKTKTLLDNEGQMSNNEVSNVVDKDRTRTTQCMGTNTNDLDSLTPEKTIYPTKTAKESPPDDYHLVSTQSSGTSTDDLNAYNTDNSYSKSMGMRIIIKSGNFKLLLITIHTSFHKVYNS